MNNQTPKIYAPISAKQRDLDNFSIIRLGIKTDKMIEFLKAHTNANGYCNLSIVPRKEKIEGKDTHSVTLDTWEPKPKNEGQNDRQTANRPADKPAEKPPVENDDVPF